MLIRKIFGNLCISYKKQRYMFSWKSNKQRTKTKMYSNFLTANYVFCIQDLKNKNQT